MATLHEADIGARIAACIHHLEHVLPGQASIRDFVHHNTLHGYQHLPFPQAVAAARRLTGASAWLPEETCRAFYRAGRIDDGDLAEAVGQVCARHAIDLDEVLARTQGRRVTRREVIRLGLLHALAPVPLARFRWLVDETGVLRDHAALWAACLDVLAIDPRFDHPEDLFELSQREGADTSARAAVGDGLAARAAALWDELQQKVGDGETAGALLAALTGEDVLAVVRPLLTRHLGAHLDLGLAPWHNPARGRGFYAAWKQSALVDIAWPLDNLSGARAILATLPEDALATVLAELARLGLPEERWPGYLERLALELPGWSGMFLWRQNHPGYGGTADVPVAMVDYLAVRLVLERLAGGDIVRRYWDMEFSLETLGEHFRRQPAELWVRHAWHSGQGEGLPEYLLDLIEPHMAPRGCAGTADADLWDWLAEHIEVWRNTRTAVSAARHGPMRSAWPLFRLCRLLDLSAEGLREAGRGGAEALLGALRQLDADQRGFIWLNAYERHYREQILGGLAANHGRWQGHAAGPTAQLVFCMDDREEGMRRHLEEIDPAVETLGGAAHFAVFQNYYGLDDVQPTALCPVVPEVIVPAHNVREVPREKVGADKAPALQGGRAENAFLAVADGDTARHRARRAVRLRWEEGLNQLTRRGLLAGPLLSVLAAPFALAGAVWRSLAPAGFGRFATAWRDAFDLSPPTRLEFTAPDDAGPATAQAPRQGFTDAEQAERVGNYLVALGLTRDFAPLVVIMGHGANSQNNPHLSAYDCGACAGRHSGPNARLFAAMANRPAVRALLAARGIDVPSASWFLGAEHNTTDDAIAWYDLEELPAERRADFARLDAALAAASRAHARERCRRLYSAPLDIDVRAALAHVIGRRHDWSQARPELGHATNACAFFGRRAMSRGAFFDRRSFLISYDPTQDPEGKVLERHLLINGAVGAGISLEYFFSTANNEHFGCGSKVTHNVTGYFGVMQGAASDLATGLPKQMIEVHEAMRLLVVVEQTLDIVTAVYQRQPPLQELVGNGWVVVAAKDPDSGAIHLFDPAGGWIPWHGNAAVATVRQSTDWFVGHREPLPPVLLERPLAT